jgi:hypothetical protein
MQNLSQNHHLCNALMTLSGSLDCFKPSNWPNRILSVQEKNDLSRELTKSTTDFSHTLNQLLVEQIFLPVQVIFT